MIGEQKEVVKLVGNSKKDEVLGIDQMGRKLSIGIAQRKPFHYDELLRVDGVSRTKAVRYSEGQINVTATFMKVRIIRMGSRGGC